MPNYIFSGETLDGKTVEGDLVHDGQDRTYILMDVMDHIKRDDYSVYMVEVRPSSVRLNTEIICDQAEQIDNLKAEVERLRGVLGSVQSAFPVLASMCRKIGLTLGEEKAKGVK